MNRKQFPPKNIEHKCNSCGEWCSVLHNAYNKQYCYKCLPKYLPLSNWG